MLTLIGLMVACYFGMLGTQLALADKNDKQELSRVIDRMLKS